MRSVSNQRATGLAKAKRTLKWQRDPEGMRLRILEAAKQEFSAHGLAGARVDRIAAKAGANKRMLYYHVGNKDELYLAVLEGAYDKIRSEERGLDLEHLAPPEAIRRLIEFTWNYFLRNPEFLSLLQTENLARAKHLKRSTKVKSMHSPFVEMIRTVVRRGVESGDFQVAVDPVQLYISIAGLSFFYLSNSATLSVIFGRDLLPRTPRTSGWRTWSACAGRADGPVGRAVRDCQGAEVARCGGCRRFVAGRRDIVRHLRDRRAASGDQYSRDALWSYAIGRGVLDSAAFAGNDTEGGATARHATRPELQTPGNRHKTSQGNH